MSRWKIKNWSSSTVYPKIQNLTKISQKICKGKKKLANNLKKITPETPDNLIDTTKETPDPSIKEIEPIGDLKGETISRDD